MDVGIAFIGEGLFITSSTARQKPTGILLFGQHYPVTTWREVFLKTIDVLRQRHATDFAEKAVALRGRKCQDIASSPLGITAPYPFGPKSTSAFTSPNIYANNS